MTECLECSVSDHATPNITIVDLLGRPLLEDIGLGKLPLWKWLKTYHGLNQTLWVEMCRWICSNVLDGFRCTKLQVIVSKVLRILALFKLLILADYVFSLCCNMFASKLQYKPQVGCVGVEQTQICLRRCLRQGLTSRPSRREYLAIFLHMINIKENF